MTKYIILGRCVDGHIRAITSVKPEQDEDFLSECDSEDEAESMIASFDRHSDDDPPGDRVVDWQIVELEV